MRRADLVSGVVVAAVGAFALLLALKMVFMTGAGVPGPGFFPTLLSSALVLLGLLLAVLAVRPATVRGPADPVAEQPPGEGERTRLRPLVVWLVFVASVPLLGLLGFVPTMVALLAVLLLAVERRRGPLPILAAIVVPVAAYELFVDLLGIQLPTGLLGPGFLGI